MGSFSGVIDQCGLHSARLLQRVLWFLGGLIYPLPEVWLLSSPQRKDDARLT